jgi:hypothetical protein
MSSTQEDVFVVEGERAAKSDWLDWGSHGHKHWTLHVDVSSLLTHVPFDSAADAIRKQLKVYMASASKELSLQLPFPPQKLFVTTVSTELEDAINSSKAILSIETDPEEGISEPYASQTWESAIKLLRQMADLFWQATGEIIPTPLIGPAVQGSIDLFWELPNGLTLLINVPADASKGATFFGRRLQLSKVSGVLGSDDIEPRHLTAWLSGTE